MATLLLVALLFGTLVAIILMIYLIDRVKRLEFLSLQNNAAANAVSDANEVVAPENGFLGLSGKVLWDAMSGKLPEGFNEADLVALKTRFEYVLQNHIESLFKIGKKDRRDGNNPSTPKNPIEISTLRGVVLSWIPPQHASTLYKSGYESVDADDVTINRLKTDIDESVSTLFSRAGLTLKQSFSDKLMSQASPMSLPSVELLDEMHEEKNEY